MTDGQLAARRWPKLFAICAKSAGHVRKHFNSDDFARLTKRYPPADLTAAENRVDALTPAERDAMAAKFARYL